ncbi:MAG: di-heme-cytochrome C peroxidase [Pseudomonadota bacterium]
MPRYPLGLLTLMTSAPVLLAACTERYEVSGNDCDSGGYHGAYADEVLLPQNWNCDERQTFWFADQGSEIIPYGWFLHLEQVDSAEKFVDPAHIDRIRYLPQKPTVWNPDGLPIGFMRSEAAAETVNGEIARDWLGMNCAACHTGQIEYGGKKYLVDGAPTMADFQGMFEGMAEAMQATLDDEAKFDRFAEAVIAETAARNDGGTTDANELRQQLERITERRHAWNARNQGSSPYGHGRLDAVGSIFNEVAASGLGVPENAHPANAPVSYPFIWDTPQHDRVEWNGAVVNAGTGALSRNVGEVLGVFGALDVNTDAGNPSGHRSSVDMEGLATLEEHLLTLWSPLWKDTDLPLDETLAAKGQADYEEFCASCHRPIKRDDPARRIKAVMIPVSDPTENPNALATDPMMAENFVERFASTSKLDGRPINYLEAISRGAIFGEAAPTVAVLGYTVIGTIVDGLINDPGSTIRALKVGQPQDLQDAIDQAAEAMAKEPGEAGFRKFLQGLAAGLAKLPEPDEHCLPKPVPPGKDPVLCYKARPLNGIWATAPYLHNGSVRTLRQLLLPAEQREKTFRVGSRSFDPEAIGFVDEGASVLDTSLPGNSNSGHDGPTYGNAVFAKDPERLEAILEYLKTL